MMRPSIVFVLTATLPALSVHAGRHHHGGGFAKNSTSNVPTTFLTITSAASTAIPGADVPATASSFIASASPASVSVAASSAGASSSGSSGSVDISLIPPFGITPGIKENDGTANCVGDKGKGIPCDCPPDVGTFASAVETFVAAGQPFPTSDSIADQLTRLETCIVTLQNFRGGAGSGVGCPAVSTTWNELRTQISSEGK